MNGKKRKVGGIDASLHSKLHASLRRKNGKASRCEHCFTTEKKRFEWALKKGCEYSDRKEDYLELCPSCHRRYDFKEETREKMSEIGKKCLQTRNPMDNPESRKKVSEFMKTRVTTEETRKKRSILNTGKKMSESAKKKISEATTGGKNPFASHLIDTVTGVRYGTIQEASKAVKVHHNRLSLMIRNIIPNETNLTYANRI